MDAKLKECPHCGSPVKLEDHRTIWCVVCTSAACGAQVLGERAPEPDGTEIDAYWDGIKQTAIDRWNARAIAPPVAAGSVDTCAEMRALCSSCGATGDVHSIDGEWRGQCNCVHAWQMRTEKAETELAAYVAQSETDFTRMEGVAEQWKTAAAAAEADVLYLNKTYAGLFDERTTLKQQAEKTEARVAALEAAISSARNYQIPCGADDLLEDALKE